MNLETIDKNLVHFEYKGSDKMKEISILEKPFSVHGMFYENREVYSIILHIMFIGFFIFLM